MTPKRPKPQRPASASVAGGSARNAPSPPNQEAQAASTPGEGQRRPEARTSQVSVAGRAYEVTVEPAAPERAPYPEAISISVDGRPYWVRVRPVPAPKVRSGVVPRSPGAPAPAEKPAELAASQARSSGARSTSAGTSRHTAVPAPLPAILLRYTVQEGQRVRSGETTVVLEAMKMELTVPAPAAGVVKELCARPGARVSKGQALLFIQSPDGDIPARQQKGDTDG